MNANVRPNEAAAGAAKTTTAVAKKADGTTVVVVGDAGSGKTSLITTLVSGLFPENPVPRVLQQVRVAPEDTDDETAMIICDTDASDTAEALARVREADVVVLVYACNDPSALEVVKSFWLVEIERVFKGPIVLACNKVDLLAATGNSSAWSEKLEREMRPLMEEHPQLDVYLDCSAKTNLHVSDLFYFAQHAVVFPVQPLFEGPGKDLKPKFRKALERVFRIFDEDHDSLLSDVEFNNFQERVMGSRLVKEDIDDIKTVLQKEAHGFVAPDGVTLNGFQHIFQIYLQRNAPESSWLVLRKFEYDDDLELSRTANPFPALRRDQSVQLTKRAVTFLTNVFTQFDEDNDGALSPREIARVFSVAPDATWMPWGPLVEQDTAVSSSSRSLASMEDFPAGFLCNGEKNPTLSGWTSAWSVAALLQPRKTWDALRVLGFHEDLGSAFKITRPRAVEDTQNKLDRQVVRAFVFGAQSVGKSSLLSALVRRGDSPEGASGERTAAAFVRPFLADASSGSSGSASQNILVLTEVPQAIGDDPNSELMSSQMVDCDLAVLLFNQADPASVDYLARVQALIPCTVPCVYFANNFTGAGASKSQENMTMEKATELCVKHSLVAPSQVSLAMPSAPGAASRWQQNVDRLFGVLLATAAVPDAARPMTDAQRSAAKQKRMIRAVQRVSTVVVVAGALITLGVWGVSKLRAGKSESSSAEAKPSSGPPPKVET